MAHKEGKWKLPSLGAMVAIAVTLTLLSQIVLVSMTLSYDRSIDNRMEAGRSEVVFNQFQQNLIYQLNDINNLLLLLQTPEFSFYFRNLMNLRDDLTVAKAENQLLNRLSSLDLQPDRVEEIYFIGANYNEKAYVKKTGSDRFEELPNLRMELLNYAKLNSLFLQDRFQFTKYSMQDFNSRIRMDYPLLEPPDKVGLQLFMERIENRIVITNGNENGVFIAIVLNDRFFSYALPENEMNTQLFTVGTTDERILWSSMTEENENVSRLLNNEAYTSTVKGLLPFKLQSVHSIKKDNSYRSQSILRVNMAVLSLLTLVCTSIISLFLTKKVLKPFRMISRKLRSQMMTADNGMVLKPLSEQLIRKGLHALSLRNKLLLVLLCSVSLPTIVDGYLYSRLLNQDVQYEMQASANTLGEFSVIGIRNRAQFMENLLFELTINEQVRNYSNSGGIDLSSIAGLNDVSYFVLLDEKGNAIYSSIYPNSKEIFNTDPKYLLKRDDPYWISNYSNHKDIFNPISNAIVKRMQSGSDSLSSTFLLLVPKESMFEVVESGPIHTSYTIKNQEGLPIYKSRSSSELKPAGLLSYVKEIPDTGWQITLDYVFNEVIEKNRLYQQQFLFLLVVVFVLSAAAAFLIANLLVKPIKRLKETMLAVGEGDLDKRVEYSEDNEIGDIINSYNLMIDRLDRTIRQNMSIMEENANNKIKENNLISMKTRAELQMLQAQINPHFLYNTLEAINMQSMKSGNQEISIIVGALAELFRYSITKGTDTALLDKELKHAANYITIQQIRFGHSFEVKYEIQEEMRGKPVLRFILQPVIENSIKHGFAGWESGGLLWIAAAEDGGQMVIRVRDNGIGMSEQVLGQLNADMVSDLTEWSGESGGIGLKNVYHRLKLFYQEEMSMTVHSGLMQGTEVVIRISLAVKQH